MKTSSSLPIAAAAAAAGLFAAMYVFTALPRIFYPYDLDFIEDSILMEAQRFALGQPVYVAPSAAFIPHVYMPFYMWLGGLLLSAAGTGYAPLRLLSFAATLLTAGLIGLIARRESGQRWLGWASAGLYLGGYRITGFWYELARVDSLFVTLSLLGLALGFYAAPTAGARGRWGQALSALCLALAFFTKQTALAFGACVAFYLLLSLGRRAWIFAGLFAGLAAGGFLALNAATGGWFYFHVVTVAGADETQLGRVARYAAFDLFGVMAALSLAAAAAAVLALRRRVTTDAQAVTTVVTTKREPWLLALAAAVVVGGAARASVGGNLNNLMPVYGLLCLAPALLWRLWPARDDWRPWVIAGGLVVQLGLGVYNPPRYIPTPAMQAAGDSLIKRIRSFDGPVLVMMHPYYAVLAGKEPSMQLPTLWSLHAWLGEPLLPGFVERIRGHYYAAIVAGESVFETDPDIRGLVETYYARSAALGPADAPPTLTGVVVRPSLVYTPK